MDFNIEVRKRQLKSLAQYIKSSKDSVDAMYKSLGWNSKKAWEKEDVKISCPVNKNHLISARTSETHIAKCRSQSLGYDLKEKFLSDPPENSSCSIKLDSTAKVTLLTKARENSTSFKAAWNGHDPDPMTVDRMMSTFSSDERLAIYDHCIKNTEAPPKPEEFSLSLNTEKDAPKELTLEEQLLQERNARRRRVKYKSVHTNRKNQTEIIREVIDNQMELYTDWLREKEALEREKLRENEKNGQEDPFENLDSSKQYHFIQVHTTYGDVSIPANALSEPLPSFNLEGSAYVDKPPSPQHSRRSSHSNRSRDKRRSKEYDKNHKNYDTRRESRRSRSLDRSKSSRSKSRHRREEPHRSLRRSRSADRSFREEADLPIHKPRRSRSRSFEAPVNKKIDDREYVSRRREVRSPPQDRSPMSRPPSPPPYRRSPNRRHSPEAYYSYDTRRSASPGRRSPFHSEHRMQEEDFEPHYFSPEREDREIFSPDRERREYDRKPVVFRGRGRGHRGRFNHFRGRGRSRGRPYFRH